MAEEFTPITSQEDFNARIKGRIERAENAVRKEYEGFADFKAKAEKYDADTSDLKSQIATLTAQVSEQSGKIKKYEIDSVKSKIAAELGIPSALADRLAGESEEDIRKDAETLSEIMKTKSRGYPLRSIEDPQDFKSEYRSLLQGLKG